VNTIYLLVYYLLMATSKIATVFHGWWHVFILLQVMFRLVLATLAELGPGKKHSARTRR
jgi:hypothetical protein